MGDEPSYRGQMEEVRGECYRRDHRRCRKEPESLATHVRPDPAYAILDSGVIRRWREKIACAAMAGVYGHAERQSELAAQVVADALACWVPRLGGLIGRVVAMLEVDDLQAAENALSDWLGTSPATLQPWW